MKVEGAHLIVEPHSQSGFFQHIHFIDCNIEIDWRHPITPLFLGCHWERCSFNLPFKELCLLSIQSYFEGDCSFGSGQEGDCHDPPPSQTCTDSA